MNNCAILLTVISRIINTSNNKAFPNEGMFPAFSVPRGLIKSEIAISVAIDYVGNVKKSGY